MSGPPGADVLLVSLGATPGLCASDAQLLASLRRAGARAELARAERPRPVRTFALTDLAWARAARRAAAEQLERHSPRAVIYSTGTAALLWPRPGAVRLDSLAAANRPGRHGVWQRPLERRRLARAPLVVPTSTGVLAEAPVRARRSVVVPIPVEPSGPPRAYREREVAALTYANHPHKKGLDRVLSAWASARRAGEELHVAGLEEPELRAYAGRVPDGVRAAGRLEAGAYRTLLRSARVFVAAARRAEHGLAPLEALADGCVLVTAESPGPYPALALARALDPRLVGSDLPGALRIALDDPAPDYAERALAGLAPHRQAAVDAVVAAELLPALLG